MMYNFSNLNSCLKEYELAVERIFDLCDENKLINALGEILGEKTGTIKTINMLQSQVCPKCKGKKFANGSICNHCHGKGEISNYKKFSVKIPAEIKDKSNRISSITINNKVFKGTELRQLLSLRSTDITIKQNNNIITITTNGYGHGVGMSQYGANYLAKQGYTYKEILNYYYQDIKIDSI